MAEYRVKFEVFEGPLDLLLYLIRKQEVDIYRVDLAKLATQFIEYIDMMRMLDIEVAGEFLVMAATLLYIKSRELLPVDQQAVDEESAEQPDADPKWELIRRLIEYKRFKDAAAALQKLECEQELRYRRGAAVAGPEPAAPAPPPLRIEASIFDLLSAFNAVLKRFQTRLGDQEVIEDQYTVTDKIEFILGLLGTVELVLFSTLFERARSRTELVVTFLALLELIRTNHVTAIQETPFGEIEIRRGPAFTQVMAPAVSATAAEPTEGNN